MNAAREFSNKAVVGVSSYDPSTRARGHQLSTAKMDRIFGPITLRSRVESAADVVKDFTARGWLN